jgi:hypothetical protein
VIVEPVTITSKDQHWVVLTLYKSTIMVLPREQFMASLRLGKRWRRAAAMKARLAGQGDTRDHRRT